MIESKVNIAAQIYNNKFLKKILKEWKKVKERKLKFIKLLLKKKLKKEQKLKLFFLNIWRINISRQKLQEKLLAHSSSCAAVINKLTQNEIQSY